MQVKKEDSYLHFANELCSTEYLQYFVLNERFRQEIFSTSYIL